MKMKCEMHGLSVCVVLLLGLLCRGSVAQIPTACADRHSLEQMTCCPVTADGVCGEHAGRGDCVSIDFHRHRNDTTDVRVNWPHYYTRICKCRGNFGGYDCSRCKYGYYGPNCASRAIIPRKPVREFSEEEWREFIAIVRMTKTWETDYSVVLEERVPGTADLAMTNVSLYNLWVWLHHYAGKNGIDLFSHDYIDYAHIGPAFFTWHRWFHIFLENEIQQMLQVTGREDYFKFRLPYWDWRREIQTSYGLPSEELFSFSRFGETRNVSNQPVVFGDLAGDWNAVCHATPIQICDPRIPTGYIQRCPFIGNPILCHSSNPDWPSLQEVNELFKLQDFAVPPYDVLAVNSFSAMVDLPRVDDVEKCRQDDYCLCAVGGPQCVGVPDNSSVLKIGVGVHGKPHFLVGLGGVAPLPPHLQGSMIDFGSAPNDPLFIIHHTMMDCILEEWTKRHPSSDFPDGPLVRDGHKKSDYLRTFFPPVTNGEVFTDPKEFGYYCQLPNLDINTPVAPSTLETKISVFINGNSVNVCVQSQTASLMKLILRDSNNKRYVRIVQGSSGCGSFTGLPVGRHRVRAISRERLLGLKGERYISKFFTFSTV